MARDVRLQEGDLVQIRASPGQAIWRISCIKNSRYKERMIAKISFWGQISYIIWGETIQVTHIHYWSIFS